MKSLLILCGLLATLSEISGMRYEQKWTSRPQQNASAICAKAPSWTLLPHLRDCHRFYACVNHVAEEFYCPENYYFDKIQLRCLPGVCYSSATTCLPHAVTRVAADCSAFSYCSGDGRQRFQEHCPPGSYYHGGYGMCVPISLTADHKCACLLPDYTTLSNPDDCETYFTCIEGSAVLRQCPRGQYYEAAVSSCLPDLEEKCLMAPTMSTIEAMALSVCQQSQMAGKIFQPAADDCGKFYVCLQGRVFIKQCRKGFYFDREGNYCRLDVEQKCDGWRQQEREKTWTQPHMTGAQSVDEVKEQKEEIDTPHFSLKKQHKEHQIYAKETRENESDNKENEKEKPQNKNAVKENKKDVQKHNENKDEVNEEKEDKKENKVKDNEGKKNNSEQKQEKNKKDLNKKNEKKKIEKENNKETAEKEEVNKKTKKEKNEHNKHNTEENIVSNDTVEDDNKIETGVPLNSGNNNNNNNKKEREIPKKKEKQPLLLQQQHETELQQLQQKPTMGNEGAPTPAHTTNEKLFSKFIKF